MKKLLCVVVAIAMLLSNLAIVASAADTTYTVAGDFLTPAWDPSANEMTQGTYEFDGAAYDYAITAEIAAAGTYNFKVTNGTWDVAYPANNFSFTTTDAGEVTIYFDSATQAIAVGGEIIDNSEFVVEVITAVGNGDGTWLNGANWDLNASANDLTEIEPGVWQIVYENIEDYDMYQVKFAVNHSWTYNWTSDGVFDGQTNPNNVVEVNGSTVTLTIDINGFDFATKEGAVVTSFVVTPPTEPTEEPSESSPDQPEPTEEPTDVPTDEPTEEPTEEPTDAPAYYTVAGDFLTPAWDPSANEMTQGTYEFDGAAYDYAITAEVAAAGTYNFKVTNGTWDVAYPANNFSFTTTDAGEVTIYFDSATQAIAVGGEIIDNSEFVVEVITAVGNGDGTWLNGANWDLNASANDLTEIEPGVWQIVYENVEAYDMYQVKFAVNHSWTYNWSSDGIFDGQTNPNNVVDVDGSTVTLTIDINGFDFATKEGAVVTSFVVTPPTDEPTEEPTEVPTDVPTDEPTDEPTDPTEPEVKNVIHFDSNTANWGEFKKVFCHVWVYGGDAFYSWQSKKQACSDEDGDGIWTYDFDDKAIALEDGVLYAVIFSNDNGAQTYNLLFDTTCLEDIAYVVENEYENPEDSSKTCQVAFWTNQDPAVYGPEMVITSLGNVIGTCIPSTTTAQNLLETFLANTTKLDNVRAYSGKNDQQIIDDIAEDLGLTAQEAADAIANTGAVVDWSEEDSLIGYVPVLGDVNGDGEISVLDATIIQRAVAKLVTLTEAEAACADVDGDGEIAVIDATIIQRFVAKLITEF